MAPQGRSRSRSSNGYRQGLSPKPKYPFDVKTLQCYYWTHGDCTWGNDCRYAHFYTGKVAEKPVKRANGFSVAGRNAMTEKPVYRKWQGQPPPAASTAMDESKNRARTGQYRWEPYSNGSRKSSLGSGAWRNERGSREQGSLAAYEGHSSSENESKGRKIPSPPLGMGKRGRSRSPVREAVKSGTHSRRARSNPRSTKPHMEVKPATFKQEHLPTRAPQYYAKQSSNRDGSGRSPEFSSTLQNNNNKNNNHHTLSNHAPRAINSHPTSPARNTTNQVEMSQYPKFNSSSDSLVTAYRDHPTEGSPPVPLAEPVTPMRMSTLAEHGQPIPSITDLPNHDNYSGSRPAPIGQMSMGRSAMGHSAGHSAAGPTSLGQRIMAHDAYGRPFQAWRAPSNDPNNPQSKLALVPTEEFNHMTAAIVQFQHTNESLRGRVSSAESTIEIQDNLLAESSIILDNGRKILLAEGQLAMDMCQKIQRGEPIHPDEVASAWLTATHMQAQANAFHRMLRDWEACISARRGNGDDGAVHSGNAGDDGDRAYSYTYSGSVPTAHSSSNNHHNSSSSAGGDYSSAHTQELASGEPSVHPGNGHSISTSHFTA